jgi:hypothetical protein
MVQIDRTTYIATKNPKGAMALLQSAGYKNKPKDARDIVTQLNDYIKTNPQDKVRIEIAKIHPDSDWIVEEYIKLSKSNPSAKEIISSGNETKAKIKAFKNAEGESTNEKKPISEKILMAAIVGGSLILTGIIVASIVRSSKGNK